MVRQLLLSSRSREILLTCVAIYISAAALSVTVAHILLIVQPESAWAQRMITPIARALEFLDVHWKAVLMIVAPFLTPVAIDLIPRLRKIGAVEFDPVPLESVGVREKPGQQPPGAS